MLTIDEKQRKIDTILNKTVLDISIFSIAGWSAGLLAGIFFHNSAPVRHILAGVGGSYGLIANRTHLKQYV